MPRLREAVDLRKAAALPHGSENRDGKTKALDEYRKAIESLQAAFEPFRPKEIDERLAAGIHQPAARRSMTRCARLSTTSEHQAAGGVFLRLRELQDQTRPRQGHRHPRLPAQAISNLMLALAEVRCHRTQEPPPPAPARGGRPRIRTQASRCRPPAAARNHLHRP